MCALQTSCMIRICSYYALGQYPWRCALQRAEQQKQLQRQAQQHAAHPDTPACSPVAASPQHTTDDQPCTPCSKTPMSQPGAEDGAAEDSSTGNNILRRLAADIRQGSPSLQATLNECRKSTASRHSSFARRSRHSDGSSDEHTTSVAALPGRGWVQVGKAG